MFKNFCITALKKFCLFYLIGIFLLLNLPIKVIKGIDYKKMFSNTMLESYFDYLSNEEDLFQVNKFSTQYFANLTENFGVNVMGSCGYVALGMLISYYDSYWDDYLCYEGYEETAVLTSDAFNTSVSSPGAIPENDVLEELEGKTEMELASNYLNNIVLQTYSDYLHMNLIMLGNMLGYYDVSKGLEAAGLTNEQLLRLTEEYFYNFRGYDSSEIGIDVIQKGATDDKDDAHGQISSFVVKKLLEGIPVLIVARDYDENGKGHAMIAYDYDWNEGKIYVHTGINTNGNALTHVSLTSMVYEKLDLAMALDIKTNHTHTDNYKYESTTYCPCSKIKENNEDPCDIPLYYRSKINFENLNCLVNNAYVTNNNVYVQTPHEYIYDCRSSFSLENVVAQVPNYGYDPYHMFLGWCLDDKLTTKVTSIPAGNRGEIILYAKWRVDYRWVAHHGELTVTSAGAMNNASDQVYVGSVEHLSQLQSMGITKLTINLHINMWEVKNGTQYIYLYGGANGSKQLASTTFNVTSSEQVKCVTFTVNISDLQETPYVYIRYNASKSGWWIFEESHDWKKDEAHVEISYVVDESDITGEDAADFVWRYENSLALKCSNCK